MKMLINYLNPFITHILLSYSFLSYRYFTLFSINTNILIISIYPFLSTLDYTVLENLTLLFYYLLFFVYYSVCNRFLSYSKFQNNNKKKTSSSYSSSCYGSTFYDINNSFIFFASSSIWSSREEIFSLQNSVVISSIWSSIVDMVNFRISSERISISGSVGISDFIVPNMEIKKSVTFYNQPRSAYFYKKNGLKWKNVSIF